MNEKSARLYMETLLTMYKATITPKMFKWMDTKISGPKFIKWAKDNGYSVMIINKKDSL